jgi:hypothetical protein
MSEACLSPSGREPAGRERWIERAHRRPVKAGRILSAPLRPPDRVRFVSGGQLDPCGFAASMEQAAGREEAPVDRDFVKGGNKAARAPSTASFRSSTANCTGSRTPR